MSEANKESGLCDACENEEFFANGRRMSQKLNAGQMNRPFFPFILRHHCMLMYHSPSRMSQSRSSFPVEYGCAVSRHNLPMSSGRSNM
ncbi:hypothetical protein RZD06_004684, partial [Escherichia coli]|nr:hypothetical protein [Escherichia coli]